VIRVWNLEKGKARQRDLLGHEGAIVSLRMFLFGYPSPVIYLATTWVGLGTIGALSACSDNAAELDAGSGDGSGSTSGGPTETGDSSTVGRTLEIPTDFEICTYSPSRGTPSFQDSPLFHFRGLFRLDAGVIELPGESGVEAEAWLPFTLQTKASGAEIRVADGRGSVSVETDRVPSSIYFLDEAAGWETVVYTDNPDAKTLNGDRFMLQVAYPTGSKKFDLAPILALDREKRLDVNAFVAAPGADEPVLRAGAAPCHVPDAVVDRLDVTLAEGMVSFHTRPALWGYFDGFTVLAEGEVDGITFSVDNYWDLDYSTSDFGGNLYGVRPLMAVRFGAQPDGACILVVEWDFQSVEEKYFAKILDCDQNKLRDLTVESIDGFAGGG